MESDGAMMFSLQGRVALVTGSARGLGAAIAACLARQGADVVVSDVPGADLEPTAVAVRSHGVSASCFALDVTKTHAIATTITDIERNAGPIDILVNNAGINIPASGLEVTEENWDRQFSVNVKGAFFATQAVATGMAARGHGRVIFISSQSGLVGIPGQPAYCATKGAVIQLARTLAVEWAEKGITVNAVAPTFVETAMTRRRLEDPEYRRFVMDHLPGGRLAAPEEVGAAVAYLAGDQAAMVNGTVLAVDGGWTAW